MDARTSAEGIEALAQRLHRPAAGLKDCANLSAEELERLVAAIDQAVEQRRGALDAALHRILFWPLRVPALRWLRR